MRNAGTYRSGPDGPPLFTLRGVHKSYHDADGRIIRVLDGVDADIAQNVMTAIVGASGEGKSTLLSLLAGIDLPDTGQIALRGAPLPSREGQAMRRYRASRVALVFQEFNLITHLTAVQNVAMPKLCQGEPMGPALRDAAALLEALGLAGRAGHRPSQLSGGEKQRVAIARAFAAGASVVLADEPTGSLDAGTAREVMEFFSKTAERLGVPVVLVTHSLELAGRYCDATHDCAGGKLVARTETPPLQGVSMKQEAPGQSGSPDSREARTA